jgi:hypothetical protein
MYVLAMTPFSWYLPLSHPSRVFLQRTLFYHVLLRPELPSLFDL